LLHWHSRTMVLHSVTFLARQGRLLAPRCFSSAEPSRYSLPEAWMPPRDHEVPDVDTFKAMHRESLQDPGKFWASFARQYVWKGAPPGDNCVDWNFDPGQGPVFINWFKGCKTNLAYNCLDRHVEAGRGDEVVIQCERNAEGEEAPFQSDSYTLLELRDEVNKLANAMRKLGVKKGDRVAVFMAHVPETCIAMLACTRIGAVHTVVFGGFGKDALAGRIIDCGAQVVLTQDGVMRGEKFVPLKGICDDALPLVESGGNEVHSVVVLRRLGADHPACAESMEMLPGRDHWWDELVADESTETETEWVDAEDPAFVMYTSGSTGKPKGILHTTGGYMVGAGTSFRHTFAVDTSMGSKDVYFCTADFGWIVGHSYSCYGPLLDAAKQVIFEGIPGHPTPARVWNIVDKYSVSHLYTSPTALRALMGSGDHHITQASRASLKLLAVAGEPTNPKVWRWCYNVVGGARCPIVDNFWQTECGSQIISPLPIEGWDLKPGSATLPYFGVNAVLLDESGQEIDGEGEGLLAIKGPWPSALRGIWGDQQRFEDTYFSVPGYYLAGDSARRDEDGYFWIVGRVDDTVIVSGHNIHTSDVESAVVQHQAVAEAAAVGVEHPIKGQCLHVFVQLVVGEVSSSELEAELRTFVRKHVRGWDFPRTRGEGWWLRF